MKITSKSAAAIAGAALALIMAPAVASAATEDTSKPTTAHQQQAPKAEFVYLTYTGGNLEGYKAEVNDQVEGTSTGQGDFKQKVQEGYFVAHRDMLVEFPTLGNPSDPWGTPAFEISGLEFSNGKVTGGLLRQEQDPHGWAQPMLQLNARNSTVKVEAINPSSTTMTNVTLTINTSQGPLELHFRGGLTWQNDTV